MYLKCHLHTEPFLQCYKKCYNGQVSVSEDGPQPVNPEPERGGHHDRLHASHLPRQPLLRGASHRGAGGTGNHLLVPYKLSCPCLYCLSVESLVFKICIPFSNNPLIIPVWTENYLKDLEESPYTASH